MNQIMHGTIVKPYGHLSKEKSISFSFPLRGYGKALGMFSVLKKIYEKSFLHDFQNVLTSRVV